MDFAIVVDVNLEIWEVPHIHVIWYIYGIYAYLERYKTSSIVATACWRLMKYIVGTDNNPMIRRRRKRNVADMETIDNLESLKATITY